MIIKKIIKIIKIKKMKSKFNQIGENFSFGNNCIFKDLRFIKIGDNFKAGNDCRIMTWEYYNNKKTGYIPNIEIGNNVMINEQCFISCVKEIKIGNGCLFGDNVFISDNFHGDNSKNEIGIPPLERKLYFKGKVIIGNNVWCGRNVAIMPDVNIGDNVIIGANAVVTHSFPSNVIIGGVPAKIIKKID